MSDINNQKFYVFLSSFGDKDAWLKKADSDGNGRVIASEFMQFVEAEWSNWSGEETPSDDIINRFWRSIDTQTTGKMYDDNLKSVDDLNALNSKEIENINKKMAVYNKIYELVNQAGLTCPNGLNATQWKNAIATELCLIFEGKDETYVKEHFKTQLPIATKNATIKVAKDTFLKEALQKNLPKGDGYDIYEDNDLENRIQNAINTLSDTATSEEIVNIIKTAINDYIETCNKKDETKNDDDKLNNIQRATLIDDINNEIEDGINSSEYKDYKKQILDLISGYKNDVLSSTTNGTLEETLNKNHWNEIKDIYSAELSKILDTGNYYLTIEYPEEVNAGEEYNITLGYTYNGSASERKVTYRINGEYINGSTFTDRKNTAGTYSYTVELLVDGKVVDSKTETITVNVVANNNNNDVNNNDGGNNGTNSSTEVTETCTTKDVFGDKKFTEAKWEGNSTNHGNINNKATAWNWAKKRAVETIEDMCDEIIKYLNKNLTGFDSNVANSVKDSVKSYYENILNGIDIFAPAGVNIKGDLYHRTEFGDKDCPIKYQANDLKDWDSLSSEHAITIRADLCSGVGYQVVFNNEHVLNKFIEEYNNLAGTSISVSDENQNNNTAIRRPGSTGSSTTTGRTGSNGSSTTTGRTGSNGNTERSVPGGTKTDPTSDQSTIEKTVKEWSDKLNEAAENYRIYDARTIVDNILNSGYEIEINCITSNYCQLSIKASDGTNMSIEIRSGGPSNFFSEFQAYINEKQNKDKEEE